MTTVKEFIAANNNNAIIFSTIEELNAQGLEIFFLKANRDLTPENIKGKMASIREVGLITPLHLIPAEKAIAEDLEIIDNQGSLVDNDKAVKGFVIGDGNNRYKAIMDLRNKTKNAGKGLEPIKCMIDTEMANILLKVMNMNNTNVKWKGRDYIKAALNQNKGNKTLEFIKTLQNLKYPDSTISLILCFDTKLKSIMPSLVTDISKLPDTCKLDRAESFLKTARMVGYPDSYIKKRYLIEAVIALVKLEYSSDSIFDAISKMTSEEVEFSINNNNFHIIRKLLEKRDNNSI